MSLPRIINITETVKDFFARKNLTAANHLYLGVIQGNFHLQSFRSCKSSISPKYSKLFSHAKLSRTQIIKTQEIVKEFFARKYLSARNHLYLGVSQESFHLQNCLNRKSSISRKNSQTFLPGKMALPQSSIAREKSKTFSAGKISRPQIIFISELSMEVFTCKNVLAENDHYPRNIRRPLCLETCLSRKSLLFRKFSKTFLDASLS